MRRTARAVDTHGAQSFSYRTCTFCGKRGYDSRSEAKAAMKFSKEPGLRVYRCWSRPDDDPGLFAFHLGHIVPRRFRENGSTEC